MTKQIVFLFVFNKKTILLLKIKKYNEFILIIMF